MKKSLLSFIPMLAALFFMALMTNHAYAQTNPQTINSIDVSKLTPEQKTQLLGQVADLQKQASNPTNISTSLRNEASQWGELGANMGRATVAAAKEVGLAANDFAQTPLGKIIIAIVVYKIIGINILHVVYGVIILTIGLGLSLYFILKSKYSEVEYENIPVLWGLYVRRVVKNGHKDCDIVLHNYLAALLCATVGVFVGTVALFNQ